MWLLSFVVNVVKFLGGCRRMRISTCSNRVLLASNWHRDHIRHNQGLKTNTLRQSFNGSLHCRWKTRPLQWHDQWHPSPLAPTLCCQPVGQSLYSLANNQRTKMNQALWHGPWGHEAMRLADWHHLRLHPWPVSGDSGSTSPNLQSLELRRPQNTKTQDIPGHPRTLGSFGSSPWWDMRSEIASKQVKIWLNMAQMHFLNIFTCSQYSQFRAVMLSSEHRRLPQQRFKADGDFASDLQSMDAHLAQIRSDPDQAQSQ